MAFTCIQCDYKGIDCAAPSILNQGMPRAVQCVPVNAAFSVIILSSRPLLRTQFLFNAITLIRLFLAMHPFCCPRILLPMMNPPANKILRTAAED